MDSQYQKEKRERFLKLAEKRTNKLLNDLRLLGNCSNKANYEYTDEEVRQMFSSIDSELKRVKALFKGKEKGNFKFQELRIRKRENGIL